MSLRLAPSGGGGTGDVVSTNTPGGDLNGTGSTYAAPVIGDGKITARKLAVLARTGGWLPTGAIDITVKGRLDNAAGTLTSGVLNVVGGCVAPAGQTVSTITFFSGSTAAGTPTHQWFCLVDKASLQVLAVTNDDTNAAWASVTAKSLTLASAYTPTNSTEVYLGIVVTAGTMPTLRAFAAGNAVASVTPVICGTADTGLTTPLTVGATIATPTGTANRPIAWMS